MMDCRRDKWASKRSKPNTADEATKHGQERDEGGRRPELFAIEEKERYIKIER